MRVLDFLDYLTYMQHHSGENRPVTIELARTSVYGPAPSVELGGVRWGVDHEHGGLILVPTHPVRLDIR